MKNVVISNPEIYANSKRFTFDCAHKSSHEEKLARTVQDLAKNLFIASKLTGAFTFKATEKGIKVTQNGMKRLLENSQEVAKKILAASQKIWDKHTREHLDTDPDSESDSLPGSVDSSAASTPRTRTAIPKISPLDSPRSNTSSSSSSRRPSFPVTPPNSTFAGKDLDPEELSRRLAPLVAAQEAQAVAEKQIEEARATIATLTEQKTALEKQLASLTIQPPVSTEDSQRMIAALTEQKAAAEKQLTELTEKARTSAEEAHASIADLTRQKETAEKQLQEQTSKIATLDETQRENASLIEKLNAEILTLREKLKDSEEQQAALTGKLKNLHTRARELLADNARDDEDFSTVQPIGVEKTALLESELKAQLDREAKLQSAYEANIEELLAAKKELLEKQSSHDSSKLTSELMLEELNEKIKLLEESLNSRLESFEAVSKEKEALAGEIRRKTKIIEEQTEAAETQSEQHAALEKQIDVLKMTITSKQEAIDALTLNTVKRDELDRVEAALEKSQDRVTRLQQQLSVTKQGIEDAIGVKTLELNERIDSLERSKKESVILIKQLQKQLQETQADRDHYKTFAGEAEQELSKKLDAHTNDLIRLEKTIAELSSENETLAEQKQALEAERNLLEQRILALYQSSKSLGEDQERELDNAKKHTAQLQKENQNLNQKIGENEDAIRALNRKRELLENQEKRLQSTIDTQTRELKALKDKHEQELAILNQKLSQLNSSLELTTGTFEETIRTLKREKSDAEIKLEELQENLKKQTEATDQALADLKKQARASKKVIAELEAQLKSQSENNQALMQHREKEIQNLNTQILKQAQQIRLAEQESKDAIAKLQELNTQLERRIEQLNNHSQADKDELEKAEKKSKELQAEIRELTKTSKKLKTALEDKTNELKKLQSEKARDSLTLTQKIAQVENEKRQADTEASIAIEALKTRTRSLEERNKTLKSQLETQLTETETLADAKRLLERRNSRLEMQSKTTRDQATIEPLQKPRGPLSSVTTQSVTAEKDTKKTVDPDKKRRQLEKRAQSVLDLNKTISGLQEQLKQQETQQPTLLTQPKSLLTRSNSTPDLSTSQDKS